MQLNADGMTVIDGTNISVKDVSDRLTQLGYVLEKMKNMFKVEVEK